MMTSGSMSCPQQLEIVTLMLAVVAWVGHVDEYHPAVAYHWKYACKRKIASWNACHPIPGVKKLSRT